MATRCVLPDGCQRAAIFGAYFAEPAGELVEAVRVFLGGLRQRLHEEADLVQIGGPRPHDERLQGAGHDLQPHPIGVEKGIDLHGVAWPALID